MMSAEILIELKSPETVSYGGIKFPKFLISRPVFEEKMAKIRGIILQSKTRLAEGASNVDAGDTHGQYHNELAWYREQEISTANKRAADLGEGLDKAVVMEGYEVLRSNIKVALGKQTLDTVTLGAKVTVEYNDDQEDTEEFMIVTPLDGGARPGWVSVTAPAAKAIEGKRVGETGLVENKKPQITLKVIRIE